MYVERLDVVSFRNHAQLSLTFREGIYSLYGPNGIGKTNFLEAIYVAMTGRSFRTNTLKEVIAFSREQAFLRARIQTDPFQKDLEIAIGEKERKYVRDNNPVPSARDYARGLAAVVFEPKHLRMVQGPPSERRSMLDEILRMSSAAYDAAYSGYHHVLYQRNYLLRKRGEADLLEVYDLRLSAYAAVLLKERLAFLKRMSKVAAAYYKEISGEKESLDIRYKATFPVAFGGDLKADFYEALRKMRKEDYERGRTAIGPHLDDLQFLLDGNEAKKYASTGQIRSIVLAVKCMEIHRLKESTGSDPVVLLDDVLSELDEARRERLLRHLRGQCFITTAEYLPFLEEYSRPLDLTEIKNASRKA